MPGQIGSSAWVSPHTSFPMRGATQQAGNHVQPDIGNFVTGVDQHARQYTHPPYSQTLGRRPSYQQQPTIQPESGGTLGSGRDELDSLNKILASIEAQLGGKDDEGNSNQGPSSTNFVEIDPGSSENVLDEGAVSVNYNTEVPAHFHLKCPVEMSYNCVTEYFTHENSTQLGAGGFGKVYEGTVTVSLLSRCVMVSDGDKREG